MKKAYRRFLVMAMAAVFLLAGQTYAADEAKSGAQVKSTAVIGGITVTGNRNISSSEILSKVRSKAGQVFEAGKAAEDAKRIAEIKGISYCYYSANLVNEKVDLVFAVVEKNVVRSITFDGNHAYKAKKLQEKLTFKIGEYLDPVMASVGVRTLTEFYKTEGFAFAKVELDSSGLSIGKVAYKVDEGPRVKIVSVKLSGNKAIKTGELKKVLKTKTRHP